MGKLLSLLLALCIILTSVPNKQLDVAAPSPEESPEQVSSIAPTQVATEQVVREVTVSPEIEYYYPYAIINTDARKTAELAATPTIPFDGKVAIVLGYPNGGELEHHAAVLIAKRYGQEKVILAKCPTNSMVEQEAVLRTVTELGADPEVKVLIIGETLPGTAEAIDKLRELREDVLIICIVPYVNDYRKIARKTDIGLTADILGDGSEMVRQAKKMSADTLVCYTLQPDMLMYPMQLAKRKLVEQECIELDIEFVEVSIPLSTEDTYIQKIQEFVQEDIFRAVATHGKDTAFLCVSNQFIGIIAGIISEAAPEAGAIIPDHRNSMYNFYAPRLVRNLNTSLYNTPEGMEETRRILAEKNMLGRISVWPETFMFTAINASMDYAIKWINGDVPKEGVDRGVLAQLMTDYAGTQAHLTPFVDEYPYTEYYRYTGEGTGETFDNFLLMRLDHLIIE